MKIKCKNDSIITFNEVSFGNCFYRADNSSFIPIHIYMKMVICYVEDKPVNAVNIRTGQVTYFEPSTLVKGLDVTAEIDN